MRKRIILIIVLALSFVGAFGYLSSTKYIDALEYFDDGGYILASSNEDAENINTQVYFEQGTTYRQSSYDNKVVFNDASNTKVSIDNNNFVHYNNKNLSGLSETVLLDTDNISENQISYYSISSRSILNRTGDSYTTSNAGENISFTNFIWKVSTERYMVVSPSITLYVSDLSQQTFEDYLEVRYIDEGVVHLVNQNGTYSTISSDAYLELENGIRIYIGSKNVSDGEAILVNMAQMVVGSDDNIEIIPDDEYKNNSQTGQSQIVVNVTEGEEGRSYLQVFYEDGYLDEGVKASTFGNADYKTLTVEQINLLTDAYIDYITGQEGEDGETPEKSGEAGKGYLQMYWETLSTDKKQEVLPGNQNKKYEDLTQEQLETLASYYEANAGKGRSYLQVFYEDGAFEEYVSNLSGAEQVNLKNNFNGKTYADIQASSTLSNTLLDSYKKYLQGSSGIKGNDGDDGKSYLQTFYEDGQYEQYLNSLTPQEKTQIENEFAGVSSYDDIKQDSELTNKLIDVYKKYLQGEKAEDGKEYLEVFYEKYYPTYVNSSAFTDDDKAELENKFGSKTYDEIKGDPSLSQELEEIYHKYLKGEDSQNEGRSYLQVFYEDYIQSTDSSIIKRLADKEIYASVYQYLDTNNQTQFHDYEKLGSNYKGGITLEAQLKADYLKFLEGSSGNKGQSYLESFYEDIIQSSNSTVQGNLVDKEIYVGKYKDSNDKFIDFSEIENDVDKKQFLIDDYLLYLKGESGEPGEGGVGGSTGPSGSTGSPGDSAENSELEFTPDRGPEFTIWTLKDDNGEEILDADGMPIEDFDVSAYGLDTAFKFDSHGVSFDNNVTGNVKYAIIEADTGVIAWERSNLNGNTLSQVNALPLSENSSVRNPVNVLKRNTDYVLIVMAKYQPAGSNNYAWSQVFQREFTTGDYGLDMTFASSTESTITMNVEVDRNAIDNYLAVTQGNTPASTYMTLVVKLYDDQKNLLNYLNDSDANNQTLLGAFENYSMSFVGEGGEQTTLSSNTDITFNKTNGTIRVPRSAFVDGNNEYINLPGNIPVVFKNLDSNRTYYAKLEATTSSGLVGTSMFDYVKCNTLKQEPVIAAPHLSVSEINNSLVVTPGYVSDPDHGVVGYEYEFYKVGPEGDEMVYSLSTSSPYEISAKLYTQSEAENGTAITNLIRGNSYYVVEKVRFNNNNKIVVVSAVSESNTVSTTSEYKWPETSISVNTYTAASVYGENEEGRTPAGIVDGTIEISNGYLIPHSAKLIVTLTSNKKVDIPGKTEPELITRTYGVNVGDYSQGNGDYIIPFTFTGLATSKSMAEADKMDYSVVVTVDSMYDNSLVVGRNPLQIIYEDPGYLSIMDKDQFRKTGDTYYDYKDLTPGQLESLEGLYKTYITTPDATGKTPLYKYFSTLSSEVITNVYEGKTLTVIQSAGNEALYEKLVDSFGLYLRNQDALYSSTKTIINKSVTLASTTASTGVYNPIYVTNYNLTGVNRKDYSETNKDDFETYVYFTLDQLALNAEKLANNNVELSTATTEKTGLDNTSLLQAKAMTAATFEIYYQKYKKDGSFELEKIATTKEPIVATKVDGFGKDYAFDKNENDEFYKNYFFTKSGTNLVDVNNNNVDFLDSTRTTGYKFYLDQTKFNFTASIRQYIEQYRADYKAHTGQTTGDYPLFLLKVGTVYDYTYGDGTTPLYKSNNTIPVGTTPETLDNIYNYKAENTDGSDDITDVWMKLAVEKTLPTWTPDHYQNEKLTKSAGFNYVKNGAAVTGKNYESYNGTNYISNLVSTDNNKLELVDDWSNLDPSTYVAYLYHGPKNWLSIDASAVKYTVYKRIDGVNVKVHETNYIDFQEANDWPYFLMYFGVEGNVENPLNPGTHHAVERGDEFYIQTQIKLKEEFTVDGVTKTGYVYPDDFYADHEFGQEHSIYEKFCENKVTPTIKMIPYDGKKNSVGVNDIFYAIISDPDSALVKNNDEYVLSYLQPHLVEETIVYEFVDINATATKIDKVPGTEDKVNNLYSLEVQNTDSSLYFNWHKTYDSTATPERIESVSEENIKSGISPEFISFDESDFSGSAGIDVFTEEDAIPTVIPDDGKGRGTGIYAFQNNTVNGSETYDVYFKIKVDNENDVNRVKKFEITFTNKVTDGNRFEEHKTLTYTGLNGAKKHTTETDIEGNQYHTYIYGYQIPINEINGEIGEDGDLTTYNIDLKLYYESNNYGLRYIDSNDTLVNGSDSHHTYNLNSDTGSYNELFKKGTYSFDYQVEETELSYFYKNATYSGKPADVEFNELNTDQMNALETAFDSTSLNNKLDAYYNKHTATIKDVIATNYVIDDEGNKALDSDNKPITSILRLSNGLDATGNAGTIGPDGIMYIPKQVITSTNTATGLKQEVVQPILTIEPNTGMYFVQLNMKLNGKGTLYHDANLYNADGSRKDYPAYYASLSDEEKMIAAGTSIVFDYDTLTTDQKTLVQNYCDNSFAHSDIDVYYYNEATAAYVKIDKLNLSTLNWEVLHTGLNANTTYKYKVSGYFKIGNAYQEVCWYAGYDANGDLQQPYEAKTKKELGNDNNELERIYSTATTINRNTKTLEMTIDFKDVHMVDFYDQDHPDIGVEKITYYIYKDSVSVDDSNLVGTKVVTGQNVYDAIKANSAYSQYDDYDSINYKYTTSVDWKPQTDKKHELDKNFIVKAVVKFNRSSEGQQTIMIPQDPKNLTSWNTGKTTDFFRFVQSTGSEKVGGVASYYATFDISGTDSMRIITGSQTDSTKLTYLVELIKEDGSPTGQVIDIKTVLEAGSPIQLVDAQDSFGTGTHKHALVTLNINSNKIQNVVLKCNNLDPGTEYYLKVFAVLDGKNVNMPGFTTSASGLVLPDNKLLSEYQHDPTGTYYYQESSKNRTPYSAEMNPTNIIMIPSTQTVYVTGTGLRQTLSKITYTVTKIGTQSDIEESFQYVGSEITSVWNEQGSETNFSLDLKTPTKFTFDNSADYHISINWYNSSGVRIGHGEGVYKGK